MSIDIKELTENDVGRWVQYQDSKDGREIGRIKSWNEIFVFVVYKCAANWHKFKDYTAMATRPEDLIFCCNKCGSPEIYKEWKGVRLCQICFEDLAADAKSVTEELEEQE